MVSDMKSDPQSIRTQYLTNYDNIYTLVIFLPQIYQLLLLTIMI